MNTHNDAARWAWRKHQTTIRALACVRKTETEMEQKSTNLNANLRMIEDTRRVQHCNWLYETISSLECVRSTKVGRSMANHKMFTYINAWMCYCWCVFQTIRATLVHMYIEIWKVVWKLLIENRNNHKENTWQTWFYSRMHSNFRY